MQPAPQEPGQEVCGHSLAKAWTHADIHKEGSRGFGVGNETQTGGLTADRSPQSSIRASGVSCVQGLPRAPGHGPFPLRQGLRRWHPWPWQRHPRLPPSSHNVSLGDCVCLPRKDTGHLDEGPSCCSMPSAQPITSARCQLPDKATFWGSGRDISLGGSLFTQYSWFGG